MGLKKRNSWGGGWGISVYLDIMPMLECVMGWLYDSYLEK